MYFAVIAAKKRTASAPSWFEYIWPAAIDESTSEDGFYYQVRTPAGSGSYTNKATRGQQGADGVSGETLVPLTTYHEEYNTEFGARIVAHIGGVISSTTYPEFVFRTSPSASAPVLSAVAFDAAQIDLTWTFTPNPANGGFIIKRDGVEITRVGAAIRTYSNTGLPAETEFDYTVTPYNSNPDIVGSLGTVSRPDSLGIISNIATETTDVASVNNDYRDLVLASDPAPLVIYPLNANVNDLINPPTTNGTNNGVAFGETNVVFESGPSALFVDGDYIQIPTIGAVSNCSATVWFECVDLPPTGEFRLWQDSGWGIFIYDSKVYGLIEGVILIGSGFTITEGVRYCVTLQREADTNWRIYINGEYIGFNGGTPNPAAYPYSSIGRNTNTPGFQIRMGWVSVHFDAATSPNEAFHDAIYNQGKFPV